MKRRRRSIVLVLAAWMIGPAAAQGVMNKEVAVHAPSRMRGFTTTRDGQWLFQCEGGVMTFIDTFDENAGAHSEAGFIDEAKRVPIGARGVLVSRMILDPLANLDPGPVDTPGNENDLLYLAGGRDGLWIMEADVTATNRANHVWRLDDSGNTTDPSQYSKRWCSDVAIMTVAGEDYLLALFSRKSGSRLRAYPLDLVRGRADPLSGETGFEINDDPSVVQVALGRHPARPPLPSGPHYARSVALTMSVDVHGVQGREVADVYVAMGHHGLVKVSFTAGTPLNSLTTWGPVFGTGSAYETSKRLRPVTKSRELYGNLEYELPRKYLDQQVIEREEFPVFTDVAVYRDDPLDPGLHHLYATVDHLFWVCFDLRNQTFDEKMPILHHEGVEVIQGPDKSKFLRGTVHFIEPLDEVDRPAGERPGGGAARSLEIVEHDTLGPFLVVTTAPRPFSKDYLITSTEGLAYSFDFAWGGGWGQGVPSKTRTFWYRIRPRYSTTFNYEGFADDAGGEYLHLPAIQEFPAQLKIFHNQKTPLDPSSTLTKAGVGLALVTAVDGEKGSLPSDDVFIRSQGHAEGSMSFNAVSSLLHPNLILRGRNDGTVPRDGFLAMGKGAGGQWLVRNYYDPLADPKNSDDRGPSGLIVDEGGQWQEPGQAADRQYMWSGGHNKTPTFTGTERWLLLDLHVPGDPLLSPPEPDRTGWWYFFPPEDRFGRTGRLHLFGGYASEEFDGFLESSGHAERHLFASQMLTSQGLQVFDRAEILAFTSRPNGTDIDLEEEKGLGTVHPTALVTHPEFNRMPAADPALQFFWKSTHPDHNSLIYNWNPRLIRVKDRGGSQFNSWVLVAPCGFVGANLDWDIYDPSKGGNLDWYPVHPTWRNNLGHGLVQFWEMAEDQNGKYGPVSYDHPGILVGDSSDDVPGNSPLRKIVTTRGESNIWKLDSFRYQDHVYLVCADFGGWVYVYDITNVLDWDDDPDLPVDPTALVAEWHAPAGLSDELPTAVFDLALDHRGGPKAVIYVGARRVGVMVLEFDTTSGSLTTLDRIQTPEYASGVHLRTNQDGTKNLVVNDYGGGVRIYED